MKFPKPKKRSLRFMSRFDALELHACVEHTQDGESFIEQEDEVLEPTMFSVYGHLISRGGVQCLEDFKTHRAALAWMKKEAERCKFERGYEDFWEHAGKEQSPRARTSGEAAHRLPLMDGAEPRNSRPTDSSAPRRSFAFSHRSSRCVKRDPSPLGGPRSRCVK